MLTTITPPRQASFYSSATSKFTMASGAESKAKSDTPVLAPINTTANRNVSSPRSTPSLRLASAHILSPSNSPIRGTTTLSPIVASAVRSSLKSPIFPSELPRSPMSATFLLTPVDGSLKTPITPPVAYMDFLKNAIASPSDLKSPKFLPHHHHPGGHMSAGPSSPMYQHAIQSGKRFRASVSGPSGGMPSPGLLSPHAYHPHAVTSASSQGKKDKQVYTPTHSSGLSSASSSTDSLLSSSSSGTDSEPVSRSSSGTSIEREPVVAESSKKAVRFVKQEDEEESAEDEEKEAEDEVMKEVDCTRQKTVNKDGSVTIKQVVTTTVTFKPRMSLMPAPKGKRRRIE